MLTVALAHARFDDGRRAMLDDVVESWEGGIGPTANDDHRAGAWATVRHGWELALDVSGGLGHVLVAQDDFRLARGGHALIRDLCDRYPDRVMCFRWPAKIDPWAGPWVASEGACWLETSYAWTGGAVALPAPLAREFLDWCETYERVLRSIRHHKAPFLDHVLRHRDDFRLDLFLISREITVWRCSWSLLHHLGDVSVVQGGARSSASPEMHLVTTVDELPPVGDPRWDGDDAPSCMGIHNDYRSAVEQLFGPRAGEVGLDHARW